MLDRLGQPAGAAGDHGGAGRQRLDRDEAERLRPGAEHDRRQCTRKQRIARRAGGLTETIEHGVNGFLVDDVIEAELAVQQVRDLDRRLIRKRALERFSPTRMAEEYEAIYRQVIEARRLTPTPA